MYFGLSLCLGVSHWGGRDYWRDNCQQIWYSTFASWMLISLEKWVPKLWCNFALDMHNSVALDPTLNRAPEMSAQSKCWLNLWLLTSFCLVSSQKFFSESVSNLLFIATTTLQPWTRTLKQINTRNCKKEKEKRSTQPNGTETPKLLRWLSLWPRCPFVLSSYSDSMTDRKPNPLLL